MMRYTVICMNRCACLLLLSLSLVLAGCLAGRTEALQEEQAPRSEKRLAGGMTPSMPAPSLPKSEDASGMAATDRDASSATTAPGKPPEKPAEERKRVFFGSCRLVVDQVEEEKRRIAGIAEQNGGYVESVYEQFIVIRVPAERFQELFALILGLGELLYKAIETYDVTEFYRDQEVRLQIARQTRERLYRLLERSEDVEERLKILREIKRLTEEIERIKLSLELLERQISFSRITVELVARLSQAQIDKQKIPFPWLAKLEPLNPTLKGRSPFNPELGNAFAVFEKEKGFRAESADGTRVRMGTTKNEPRGDAAFWRQALVHHLGPFYKKSESRRIGAFQAVLLTSKDRQPFFYLIGVLGSAESKDLAVLEIFFPNRQALDRHYQALQAALEQVGVK